MNQNQKPFEDKLRVITPYVPGEQSKDGDIIKLNANENPYPPSPKVASALRRFNSESLKLYPPADNGELITVLAKYYGVERGQVFVGNGSDDVIAQCYMAFFNSKKPILFPDITYSFYPVWCELFQVPYVTKSVDKNLRIYAKDYYDDNGGVILPNPNAPTGISEDLDFIREILDHNRDCIVIIDEAYVDFGGRSAVALIPEYENLIVVQTFSKSRSLAGMRLGVALGSSELINLLNSIKNSYNSYPVDKLAMAAAIASIEDDGYFRQITNKIIQTRERTAKRLAALGFTVYPSHSNFLFVTHPKHEAKTLFEACREAKIFIRYFNLPRINNHLRISIGTDEEMNILIDFLENYINP